MIEIWLAFMAGMTGSFHCIGMCGGIVAALSINGDGLSFRSRLQSQVGYNLGRITTYTVLGATAGVLGASLDLLTVKPFVFWLLVAAHLFVVAVGLSSALGFNRFNLSSLEAPSASLLAAPLRRAVNGDSRFRSLYLGLALGFLPCGLVYAPLIAAAGTGSPLMGAATMAALGMGTLPVLLAFGTASSALSARLRNWMVRAAGVAVALMGAAGLWRAFSRHCCG